MSQAAPTTVVLYSVERLNNSTNGNPRFSLWTSQGTFTTKSDASVNYDVENVANKIPAGEGVLVHLTLTRAGRVEGMEVSEWPVV